MGQAKGLSALMDKTTVLPDLSTLGHPFLSVVTFSIHFGPFSDPPFQRKHVFGLNQFNPEMIGEKWKSVVLWKIPKIMNFSGFY